MFCSDCTCDQFPYWRCVAVRVHCAFLSYVHPSPLSRRFTSRRFVPNCASCFLMYFLSSSSSSSSSFRPSINVGQVLGFSAALLGLPPAPAPSETKPIKPEHSFLLMHWKPELLAGLKSKATAECKQLAAAEASSGKEEGQNFVSTNDLVTAAGWVLMRRLSGRADWGMNVIVNIRGRGGTSDFGAGFGLFGNGITAATARVPPLDSASLWICLQALGCGKPLGVSNYIP